MDWIPLLHIDIMSITIIYLDVICISLEISYLIGYSKSQIYIIYSEK